MWLVVSETIVVSVAVDQSVYQIDKPYDYLVPQIFNETVKIGCRVLVPFGKGNVRKTGVVLSFSNFQPDSKLKSVIEILDSEPILSEKMLELAAFIREQTFCTWYNAIRVLIPPGINYKIRTLYELSENYNLFVSELDAKLLEIVEFFQKKKCPVQKDVVYASLGLDNDCGYIDKLISKGVLVKTGSAVRNVGDAALKMVRVTELASDLSLFKLTPKQKQILAVLNDVECCSVKELLYFTGLSSAVISSLQKKGIVEVFEQEYYRNPYDNIETQTQDNALLTDIQQKAFNDLYNAYLNNTYNTALLYGVTGSGKTQVFLKMCEEVVNSGRGVIVMVPEIALTPQTLNIFHKRFGSNVAVFHSAMSQGQRLDEWKRVKNGDAKIAVGTRSAVFAPFSDVGLIIMDEEQEHTYKSEMIPHFHARDIARFRVAQNKGLLVLSSATPSIESYSLALSGKYLLCKLDKRYGTAVLPDVKTVDMRQEIQNGNKGVISNLLYDYINDALLDKKQAILLLNRRGFNTYISCSKCGYIATCDACSISMTYHSANNRLMCHYCGKSVPYIHECPNCGNENIKYSGIGTQKAELELQSLFPNAKILRMDADSIMTRSDYESNLKAFSDGKYDILLGTQMVAKGLDFPNVTVVGVLNSDNSMHSSDFRSFERTFSLLTQVVGRSGRGKYKGTAIIQTNEPESSLISLAAQQNYDQFYSSEILTRKLMVYPPYCDIATACFSGNERKYTEDAAKHFFTLLTTKATGDFDDVKIILLGPTVAAVPKVNNNYRYKIIIKYKNSKRFREMLAIVLKDYNSHVFSKKVSVYIDVNPDSII